MRKFQNTAFNYIATLVNLFFRYNQRRRKPYDVSMCWLRQQTIVCKLHANVPGGFAFWFVVNNNCVQKSFAPYKW